MGVEHLHPVDVSGGPVDEVAAREIGHPRRHQRPEGAEEVDAHARQEAEGHLMPQVLLEVAGDRLQAAAHRQRPHPGPEEGRGPHRRSHHQPGGHADQSDVEPEIHGAGEKRARHRPRHRTQRPQHPRQMPHVGPAPIRA